MASSSSNPQLAASSSISVSSHLPVRMLLILLLLLLLLLLLQLTIWIRVTFSWIGGHEEDEIIQIFPGSDGHDFCKHYWLRER